MTVIPFFAPLVCNMPVDLVVLIDGSGSIERAGRGNFGRCVDFVKSLLSFFPVSRRGTHVGVALYSSRPVPIFSLTRHYTRAAMIAALNRVRYPRGLTRIGRALRFAKNYFFARSPATRKKTLVLLTDGISKDPVGGPAASLRTLGVEIFVLGIGRAVRRQQLVAMATDRRHVFGVSFRSLGSVVKTIKGKVCRPAPYTPSKTPSCPM